ncbi:LIM and senescent cell antigen-like-containing domain protein 1 [Zophobas morio]|uniref:LIM and senescent cell antigen-like-containing domain protein 1 n=1 Tax=Zophobas morio TaxID=2755281 RepID=UPI00308391F4
MCDTCFKNLKKKTEKTRYCHKCQEPLDLEFIVIRGLRYHPKHFLCAAPDCKRVLDHSAQEKDNLLYCKSCYHKITVLPTCAACRRVIEGPSRSALGKHWHPEHLVCKKCDMPLLGMLVYEHKGNAYCLTHFTEVAGDVCSFCLAPIMTHKKIKALDKYWCKDHFTCFACDKPLEKFFGVDFRLYCEECFLELPDKVRKQLDQLEALEKKYQKQKKKSRAKYYEKYGLEK